MQAGAPAAIEEEVACQQVRIALAQQRLVTAEVVLQKYGFSFQSTFSFPEIETERGFTYSRGLLSNSGLRVLLHHAQARRDPASLELGIARADRLIAGALQRRYVVVALEALLLRGQMHDVLGHHQAGLNDYVQALEMAEPEGCISVFIEAGVPVVATLTNLLERGRLETAPAAHVKKILAIYSSSQPVDTTSDQLPTPPLSHQI
jgi:hypothetical protein